MKKVISTIIVLSCMMSVVVLSCKQKEEHKLGDDTIVEGTTDVLVDESLLPIIEDQKIVFESTYNAKITLIPQSEKESVLSLFDKKAKIIVLSRKLDADETKILEQQKIFPKTAKVATDAIALIKSKVANDTLIALNDIIEFIKGKQNGIKGLVFDNPNSSSVRYLTELANVKSLPEKGIYSFKTNDEVIKYVSQNEGLIGVVGLNWILQPKATMQSYIDKVALMSVKGASNEYIYPSQDNIAMNKYPLARDLYIINCQGYQGLGIGFSSFIAGERGQRIILKSGLFPVRMPGRKIVTRNQIENESK